MLVQQLRDGVADTTKVTLADQSLPVSNDMLKKTGYLPRQIAVTEMSIMVVFDRQDDEGVIRRLNASEQRKKRFTKRK